MEDLHLGRIAALVPEFAVKDLPLGGTLMMMMMMMIVNVLRLAALDLVLEKTFLDHYFYA